jgi:hypothetical protein
MSKSSETKSNSSNTTQLDESDHVIPYIRRPIIESAGEPISVIGPILQQLLIQRQQQGVVPGNLISEFRARAR